MEITTRVLLARLLTASRSCVSQRTSFGEQDESIPRTIADISLSLSLLRPAMAHLRDAIARSP